MAAHRYWRLHVSGSSSGDVRVSEILMRTSIGGANVATGGSVFASSTNPSFPATSAFDGVSTTFWESGLGSPGNEHTLGYDFGSGNDKDIVEVVAEFHSSISQTSKLPTCVRVEFSDDGLTWVSVAPGFSQAAAFGTYTYGPLAALGTVRVSGVRPRINPGWPNPTAFVKRVSGAALRNRTQDSGVYRINGTVKVDGSPDTPVARKVVLFDQVSLRPLQDVFSDGSTGDYEFTHLANKPHMVMAFDHTNNFRAVVADRVMPEPMP